MREVAGAWGHMVKGEMGGRGWVWCGVAMLLVFVNLLVWPLHG